MRLIAFSRFCLSFTIPARFFEYLCKILNKITLYFKFRQEGGKAAIRFRAPPAASGWTGVWNALAFHCCNSSDLPMQILRGFRFNPWRVPRKLLR
jgi:hypothetical protein